MSLDNIFGPIVTKRMVAEGLTDHIRLWMPDYLREVERIVPDRTPGDLPLLDGRGYVASETEVVYFAENSRLPALIVGSPGWEGQPGTAGDGRHDATWIFACNIVVSGNDEDSTDRLAGEYTAALRALLAQQTLFADGQASVERLMDEGYDRLPFSASRSLAAGTVTVLVMVEDVVRSGIGPTEPSDDPTIDPGGLPEIEDTLLTVTRLED